MQTSFYFLIKKATNGIRTHDLSLTKRVLYQLSYSGNITPSVGIEPTAIGLKGQRSTIWAKKALHTTQSFNDSFMHML